MTTDEKVDKICAELNALENKYGFGLWNRNGKFCVELDGESHRIYYRSKGWEREE
jgi:hypothetical protein